MALVKTKQEFLLLLYEDVELNVVCKTASF